MAKVQKNLSLHPRTVDVYLPALRKAFGTYSNVVDVAVSNLYHRVVADAVGISDDLARLEKIAAALGTHHDTIEWRYAPRQAFDEVPRWAYLRFDYGKDAWEAARESLTAEGVPFSSERDGYHYYIILRTQTLSDRADQRL